MRTFLGYQSVLILRIHKTPFFSWLTSDHCSGQWSLLRKNNRIHSIEVRSLILIFSLLFREATNLMNSSIICLFLIFFYSCHITAFILESRSRKLNVVSRAKNGFGKSFDSTEGTRKPNVITPKVDQNSIEKFLMVYTCKLCSCRNAQMVNFVCNLNFFVKMTNCWLQVAKVAYNSV